MNGITLEKLQVIIEAQTQDLRNELAKVKQQLTSTSSAVKKETGKISNSFGGMIAFMSIFEFIFKGNASNWIRQVGTM